MNCLYSVFHHKAAFAALFYDISDLLRCQFFCPDQSGIDASSRFIAVRGRVSFFLLGLKRNRLDLPIVDTAEEKECADQREHLRDRICHPYAGYAEES